MARLDIFSIPSFYARSVGDFVESFIQDNRDNACHKVKVLIYHPGWLETSANRPEFWTHPSNRSTGRQFSPHSVSPDMNFHGNLVVNTTCFT
jgi:hypothetical protein